MTLQEAMTQPGAIGATWTGTPFANGRVPEWAAHSTGWQPRFPPAPASTAMALEALCTATLHAQGAQVSELKRQVISLKRELAAARQKFEEVVEKTLVARDLLATHLCVSSDEDDTDRGIMQASDELDEAARVIRGEIDEEASDSETEPE